MNVPPPQVPGFLLLRDVSGGVFFLPPDTDGDGLAQLDLSDDVVVAELFYSSAWQVGGCRVGRWRAGGWVGGWVGGWRMAWRCLVEVVGEGGGTGVSDGG